MTERSYGQFCGIAQALDLIGERWALLVVRDLILGPKRFTDLERALPGVGTNVLSSRLKELERNGVIVRRVLPAPAAATVYELTEYGRELEPILLDLGRWGVKSLGARRPGQSLRTGWIGVALRAFTRPEASAGIHGTVEFRLDDGVVHAILDDGAVQVADGPAPSPTLVLETGNEALLALLAGLAREEDLAAGGALQVSGNAELVDVLRRVFRFPQPEAAAA
jgi:DNA-binding HxlR family transcriptional regulator